MDNDQPTRQLLTKVTIDGLKSIKHAEIELRPMNLIVGANGAGKSNFIFVMKLLFNCFNNGFLYRLSSMDFNRYVSKLGGASRFLHFGSKQTKSAFILVESPMRNTLCDSSFEFLLRFEPTVNSGLIIAKFNYGLKNPEAITEDAIDYLDLNHFNSECFDMLQDDFEEAKAYHFHDTSFNAPLRTPERKDNYLDLAEDGSNLPSFLLHLKQTYLDSYKMIVSTITRVAPFFKDFILEPEEFVKLRWKHTSSDAYFDVADLSDGTLRFIALATVLLQPDKTLPKLIMIDEPELGLHPHALHLLAGMMQSCSARTQLIVATQSVTLLNQFTYQDLIIADFDDDQGCTTFKRPTEEDAKFWAEDYGLGELWERNWIGGTP